MRHEAGTALEREQRRRRCTPARRSRPATSVRCRFRSKSREAAGSTSSTYSCPAATRRLTRSVAMRVPGCVTKPFEWRTLISKPFPVRRTPATPTASHCNRALTSGASGGCLSVARIGHRPRPIRSDACPKRPPRCRLGRVSARRLRTHATFLPNSAPCPPKIWRPRPSHFSVTCSTCSASARSDQPDHPDRHLHRDRQ
jgi:hypothetical protein